MPLSNGDPPIRVHQQQKLMVNGGGCSGGFCVLVDTQAPGRMVYSPITQPAFVLEGALSHILSTM